MNTLPKIVDVILCEEIRQEASGKFMLLGAYASDIRIQAIPGFLSLSLLAELAVEAASEFDAELQVLDPKGEAILKGRIKGSFAAQGRSAMSVGPLPVSITMPGEYKIQWRHDGQRWTTIKQFRVALDPTILGQGRHVAFPLPIANQK